MLSLWSARWPRPRLNASVLVALQLDKVGGAAAWHVRGELTVRRDGAPLSLLLACMGSMEGEHPLEGPTWASLRSMTRLRHHSTLQGGSGKEGSREEAVVGRGNRQSRHQRSAGGPQLMVAPAAASGSQAARAAGAHKEIQLKAQLERVLLLLILSTVMMEVATAAAHSQKMAHRPSRATLNLPRICVGGRGRAGRRPGRRVEGAAGDAAARAWSCTKPISLASAA